MKTYSLSYNTFHMYFIRFILLKTLVRLYLCCLCPAYTSARARETLNAHKWFGHIEPVCTTGVWLRSYELLWAATFAAVIAIHADFDM